MIQLSPEVWELKEMKLGEEKRIGPCCYCRVVGGWIVSIFNGPNPNLCFVPFPKTGE